MGEEVCGTWYIPFLKIEMEFDLDQLTSLLPPVLTFDVSYVLFKTKQNKKRSTFWRDGLVAALPWVDSMMKTLRYLF